MAKIRSAKGKNQVLPKLNALGFYENTTQPLFPEEKVSSRRDEDVQISDGKGGLHNKNQLNDLTAKEWIIETVSVWNQRGLGGRPSRCAN